MKERINISLDSDVIEKIDLFAKENYLTRSAALTKLIMDCKVKGETQVPGQLNFKGVK